MHGNLNSSLPFRHHWQVRNFNSSILFRHHWKVRNLNSLPFSYHWQVLRHCPPFLSYVCVTYCWFNCSPFASSDQYGITWIHSMYIRHDFIVFWMRHFTQMWINQIVSKSVLSAIFLPFLSPLKHVYILLIFYYTIYKKIRTVF